MMLYDTTYCIQNKRETKNSNKLGGKPIMFIIVEE